MSFVILEALLHHTGESPKPLQKNLRIIEYGSRTILKYIILKNCTMRLHRRMNDQYQTEEPLQK